MRRRQSGRAPAGVAWRDLRPLSTAFVLIALWLAGAADLRAEEAATRLEQLDIVTSSGSHPFLVEVMRTEAERERGLMFRRALPQDRGMLFDFGSERLVQMWMKNTYLPLDMIFLSKSGKVVGLAEDAEPLSERIISSGAPAAGVVELNAGVVARIGVRIGDSVRHPLFRQMIARAGSS